MDCERRKPLSHPLRRVEESFGVRGSPGNLLAWSAEPTARRVRESRTVRKRGADQPELSLCIILIEPRSAGPNGMPAGDIEESIDRSALGRLQIRGRRFAGEDRDVPSKQILLLIPENALEVRPLRNVRPCLGGRC